MVRSHNKVSRSRLITRDNIARAVFAAAESMGVTDREMLEQLTEQVSKRLKVAQPLPGMEKFVSPQRRQRVSTPLLEAIINEVMSADEFSP